jgi:Ni,Fe-hydrogenase III component G
MRAVVNDSNLCYLSDTTAKRRRTLNAVFAIPTRVNVRFSDVAALVVALGGEVREGAGARVVCELKERRLYLHRPHPGHEARRYQVEEVRKLLRASGIQP